MAAAPLSVVILTKNEAGRIQDCLRSVAWAAERLVVDDESTDETVAIAQGAGARVLRRRMDLEGRHRNWSYAQAAHEWVLSLDADERVTPELRVEIEQLLSASPGPNGFAIPRRNYLGRRWLQHGGFYPSAQLRLFRKSCFRYEEAEVHPRIFLDGATGRLQGDIIHLSYRNLEDFTAKLNRQTTLEAAKWRRDQRPMTLGKGLWRTVDRFGRTYWGKRGRRDGTAGFIMAGLAGIYQFLSYAKYWMACRATPPSPTLEAVAGRLPPLVGARRQTIAAVILTKNEAARISRCLDAVAGWVDQIIVVDGESTDGTPDLCRQAGAQVIMHRFDGSFAQERNLGTAQATADWVLQLDADDRVTPAFRQAATQILEHGSPHAAYRFRRWNVFLGRAMRHGGWDHYSLHLFRRGRARYEGRVHETLLVDGSIGTLEAPIEHHPFSSLEQFVDRQNRYTTLEARQLMEQHGPPEERTVRRQLRVRPLTLWWKIIVKKQGFREGMHGFLFAGLFSFVHFLKWAKYWELGEHARDLP